MRNPYLQRSVSDLPLPTTYNLPDPAFFNSYNDIGLQYPRAPRRTSSQPSDGLQTMFSALNLQRDAVNSQSAEQNRALIETNSALRARLESIEEDRGAIHPPSSAPSFISPQLNGGTPQPAGTVPGIQAAPPSLPLPHSNINAGNLPSLWDTKRLSTSQKKVKTATQVCRSHSFLASSNSFAALRDKGVSHRLWCQFARSLALAR